MRVPYFTATAIAVLASLVEAHPTVDGYAIHEAREPSSDSLWIKRARADASLKVPVRVGLTQSNLDQGAEMLMEISHPASSKYGKYLSKQDILEFFAPSEDRINSVKSWIKSSPLDARPISLSSNKQWLQFEATISELQDLLLTKYHEYEHSETGKLTLGCDEYHVPQHVRGHIDFITPGVKTLDFEKRAVLGKRDNKVGGGKIHPQITPVTEGTFANGVQDCSFAITPDCVKTLYNITDTVKGNPSNSIGVYETEQELYNQTDLNAYFATFAPNIPSGTHPTFQSIDGAPPPSNATGTGGEADLDFEVVYPFVYPDQIVNYQVDDYYYSTVGSVNISGIFNTFLDAIDGSYCTYSAFGETGDDPKIDATYPDTHPGGYNHPEQCGAYPPTKVISISYSIDEDRLPLNYQRRQCNEWMKLGLQGISVVVSSGDTGVAPRNRLCARNNTLFATQSPIDCPYVTAVGATVLPPGSIAGKDPETASTSFGSGGGFSNIFPQPSYQSNAVSSYFKNSPPPYPYYNITYNATHTTGIYNRGGRGYPDVSATGQNYAGFVAGRSSLLAGTSVSAPVFAALIARINSARLNAGKKTVGFLNPTLYQHPEVFNDITKGNNPGCGTNGFDAVKGWDPATGLGTPNYGKMKAVFMGLP